MSRLDTNLQILELLREYLITHPGQRFEQALVNLGIIRFQRPLWANETPKVIDPYNDEFTQTLAKVLEHLDTISGNA